MGVCDLCGFKDELIPLDNGDWVCFECFCDEEYMHDEDSGYTIVIKIKQLPGGNIGLEHSDNPEDIMYWKNLPHLHETPEVFKRFNRKLKRKRHGTH